MCIIILAPSGTIIPEDHIKQSWNNGNSDGAGYMFEANGKLVIRKPFFKLGRLIKAYDEDRLAYPDSTFIMHLRFSTNGTNIKRNTHPFALNGGNVGLAHNGVLKDFSHDMRVSDTRLFCETVLVSRSREQLLSVKFGETLGKMIGHNKFALLDCMGEWSIVNEDLGDWNNGLWYSNHTYLPSKVGYSIWAQEWEEEDEDEDEFAYLDEPFATELTDDEAEQAVKAFLARPRNEV